MTRQQELDEFLRNVGLGGAIVRPLAGDASHRKYLRIHEPASGDTLVLMDAPVATCGSLEPFIRTNTFLEQAGCSVPTIVAMDEARGTLLLEDLGDDLVSRVVASNPGLEPDIYGVAVDLLAGLRSHVPGKGFPVHSTEIQAELAELSLRWYRAGAMNETPSQATCREMRQIFGELLSGLNGRRVFVHRDYHAENLIWLPGRNGIRRLGIIDHQDGSIGHPAYDLVSILEDARRDVPDHLRTSLILRYANATGVEERDLLRDLAICGAQRNLRILGVFARLALRDGKSGYLDLIPRVWRHLERDLSHPIASNLARFVFGHLPRPDRTVLDKIRAAVPS